MILVLSIKLTIRTVFGKANPHWPMFYFVNLWRPIIREPNVIKAQKEKVCLRGLWVAYVYKGSTWNYLHII